MWSVQRSLPFTSAGRLCIHELFERSWRRPISTRSPFRSRSSAGAQPLRSATIALGRELDLAGRRAQHLGQARLVRAEVHAVRVALERVEGEAGGRSRRRRPRTGPTRSMKSSIRSGPRRGSSASSSSAGSRPSTREPGVATSRCTSVAITRSSSASTSASGPGPLTTPARRSRSSHSAGPSPLEHGAASSWPRCARPAGRARGRSATSRAAAGAGRITSAWRVVSFT